MTSKFALEIVSFHEKKNPNLLYFIKNNDLDVISKDVPSEIIKSLKKHMELEKFSGEFGKTIVHFANDENINRIVLVGIGEFENIDQVDIGGKLSSLLSFDTSIMNIDIMDVHDIVMGLKLGEYSFDNYKTDNEGKNTFLIGLHTNNIDVVMDNVNKASSVVNGVNLTRDLVNLPPNVLNPDKFEEMTKTLAKNGVSVEVLDEDHLNDLGFGALTAVGRGSSYKSRLITMRYNGGNQNDQPVAFVGKGVTFDSGGISIKPSGGMEDMKGDMAGAAAVVGLMHTLSSRKAKVNVVGVIGVVENMPSGNSMRPGDIVTSLSGKTIEVVNTDAEGRMVLADALFYTEKMFNPKVMINLATLTGAILVALGKTNAGLFSNNDELSEQLLNAGKKTKETLWRLPLQKEYDELINSKFADMKNSGSRYAGSITAAQFLQRFVNKVSWAHLDIAGTGMDSEKTSYSKSWASGWGVRLLNQFVKDYHEN